MTPRWRSAIRLSDSSHGCCWHPERQQHATTGGTIGRALDQATQQPSAETGKSAEYRHYSRTMVHRLRSTYHTVLGRLQRLHRDTLELMAWPRDFTWQVVVLNQPGHEVMRVFGV